jgi:hypothetical protein
LKENRHWITLEKQAFPKHLCKRFFFLTQSKAWIKMLFLVANAQERTEIVSFELNSQLMLIDKYFLEAVWFNRYVFRV